MGSAVAWIVTVSLAKAGKQSEPMTANPPLMWEAVSWYSEVAAAWPSMVRMMELLRRRQH